MLPDLQDRPSHGEPAALVLGKPAQAAAHGQPGLRFPAFPAGATPRCIGPGPAPNLVPQSRGAVPPCCDTALQIKGCSKCPVAVLSPFPKYGITHVSRSVSAFSTILKGNLSKSYFNILFENRKMKAGVGKSATERAIYKIFISHVFGPPSPAIRLFYRAGASLFPMASPKNYQRDGTNGQREQWVEDQ